MHHRKNLEKLRDHLKILGRKYTSEKEELLKVIYSMEGVYSLEELYEKASRRKVIYAKSTIYRTIDIFVNAGFIKEAGLSSGRKRYETNHMAFSQKQGN
jgi:Fur family ferric uptake transcriptional regulator